MSLGNPYVVDRPLDEGDPLAARHRLLVEVVQAVRRGRQLLLVYGSARMGKTTFLHQLAADLSPEFTVMSVDWSWPQGSEAEAAMQDLRARIATGLGTALRQSMTDLAAALDAVRDQRVAIHVDGLRAADLCREAGGQFMAEWQEWLRSRPRVHLVLTVDGSADGAALCNPLVGALPYVELKGLTLEETEELLLRPARGRLAYNYDAVRRIWRLSSGHPYLVQLFGQTLFCARSGHGRVQIHDAEQAVQGVVDASDPVMERIWQSCSPEAQVLLAVSNELRGRHGVLTVRDLQNAALQCGLEFPAPAIETALSASLTVGALRRLSAEGYALYADVFRQWLAQRKPLPQVLDTLRQERRSLPARVLKAPRTVRWSTIGAWLAGIALLVAVVALWSMRGAAERRVAGLSPTTTPTAFAMQQTPVLGPALGRIAYMAKEKPDATGDIWVMRGDGSDPRRLTDDPANDMSPTWSPDGKSIAFVSERDGNKEIYVMKADGTQQINLTHHPADDGTPAWSPDGVSIAFSSYRDGNWELYVMDAGGSNPKRLTQHNAADLAPSWSPDGKKIVFQSNRDGNWELYGIGRDGTGLERLTSDAATDSAPAWSPDGSAIVFETYRDGDMEIYWMSADGSDQRDISNDHYSNDHGPAWARDGTRLLYYSNRDGGWDIYSMKPDGTEKSNLTLSPAQEQGPVWHE